MEQQNKEIQILSKNLKIRNKVLMKLLKILYPKIRIKFRNKTEEQIWGKIKQMDQRHGYLKEVENENRN